MKIMVAAFLYCLLFLAVETVTRRLNLGKEGSRKFVHVVAGVAAALLPLFMTFHQIAFLSLLFIPVMLLSKKLNFFSSIHEVERRTYGEVYFPLAILIVALAFPERAIYIYGLLVMAVSDGFASIIGQKYGHKKYKLWASRKSFVGSFTFFLLTSFMGFVVLAAVGASVIQAVISGLLLAAVLTFAEGVLSYGLDNLILPPLAGLLLWTVINLLNLN